jgi:hypothetical protein
MFRRSSALPRRAALVLASLLAAAVPAAAQDVPSRESAIEIRARFLAELETMRGKFVALAEAIPAEKYSWRPAPGVRSIGEAFMHVASEFYYYVPLAYGAQPSPVIQRGRENFVKFEASSSKADVMKHLPESFAYTKQAIEGLAPAAITGKIRVFGQEGTIIESTLAMSGDLHEHMGQLIAYARSNNVKPPWSK